MFIFFVHKLPFSLLVKEAIIQQVLLVLTLLLTPDQRQCPYETGSHKLLSGLLYKISTKGERQGPLHLFIWRNFTPLESNSSAGYLSMKESKARTICCRRTLWKMQPVSSVHWRLKRLTTSSRRAHLLLLSSLTLVAAPST